MYKFLSKLLLFTLQPELARSIVDFFLKREKIWEILSPVFEIRDSKLKVDLCGLKLNNPVGLAAGFDKNCELISPLSNLGFGYLVVGTVTENPKPGNPKPRIFRYLKEESLINSLGFPNNGLEHSARELEKIQFQLNRTSLITSVSGTSVNQIVRCHQRLEPLSNAIEINISSPNTKGLKIFQEPSMLCNLIGKINESRSKPLLLKMTPYKHPKSNDDNKERDEVMELIKVCLANGVNGLTIANTRITKDARLSSGTGGLSGRLLFQDTIRMISEIKSEVGNKIDLNACGGIFTGQEAWEALQAGATTIQLYTGMIYVGPSVVKQINKDLIDLINKTKTQSLQSSLPQTRYTDTIP